MKSTLAAAVLGLATLGVIGTGCTSSKSDDVTTTGRSQYVTVSTNVMQTTDVAKQVLTDHALKNVKGTSTMDDGKVTGDKADGTEVKVYITRKDAGSGVQVTVGLIGGPDLGATIARDIKTRADGSASSAHDMGTMHHDSATTMRSGM